MTAYALPAGGGHASLTMGYDDDGMRAWKENSSSTRTYFLYDGSDIVAELTSAGALGTYQTVGADGVVSRRAGITTTYFAFDPEGSVSAVLNYTGTVRGNEMFEANGHRDGSYSDRPVDFGGQWGYYGDSETGLTLLGHRYYDSYAGRFLTRDPIGYNGGVNLYGYTANNFENESDASGLQAYLVTDHNGSYVMDVPSGQNIDRNIQEALAWHKAHPNASPVDIRNYVSARVHHGTVGDYKDYPDVHDPKTRQERDLAGNFNFGAISFALGVPETGCALAGHGFHVDDTYKEGAKDKSGLTSIWSGVLSVLRDPVHPDDRQQAIEDGAEYYINQYMHFRGRDTIKSIVPIK